MSFLKEILFPHRVDPSETVTREVKKRPLPYSRFDPHLLNPVEKSFHPQRDLERDVQTIYSRFRISGNN